MMDVPSSRPPPKIVVADDDPPRRELLGFTLRDEGYDVVELPDGGRLLVQLETHFTSVDRLPADLVISDIRMPVLSGLAMLRALERVHAALSAREVSGGAARR